MKAEIISRIHLSQTTTEQTLVRCDDLFFVVSSVDAPFSGFETLVFPAAPDGTITDFAEVAGGRQMSQAEAIADLEASLSRTS